MLRRLAVIATAVLLLGAKSSSGDKKMTAKDGPHTPEDYIVMASTQVDLGDLAEAEETARTGMKKFPDYAGFHFVLGHVYQARQKYADAFYEYQWELLRVGHTRELGQISAGRCQELLVQRGTDGDEIRRVVKALANANDAKAQLKELQAVEEDRGARFVLRLWIAEAKLRGGDTGGAIAIYRELITKDKFFVPAYVALGEALSKAGKKAESQQMMSKAKKIDPDNWRLKQ